MISITSSSCHHIARNKSSSTISDLGTFSIRFGRDSDDDLRDCRLMGPNHQSSLFRLTVFRMEHYRAEKTKKRGEERQHKRRLRLAHGDRPRPAL